MQKSRSSLLLFLSLIGPGIATLTVSAHRLSHPVATARALAPAAVVRPPYDPTFSQKQIAFYAAGARRDPKGAIIRSMLAASYLQRCRETGDIGDALRAEQAARSSLALRTRHNEAAYRVLALSLLTQHRFNEALHIAEKPESSGKSSFNVATTESNYLLAEIHMERGDYKEAEADLRGEQDQPESIMGLALRARMLELNGQPDQALVLLREAQSAADEDANMSRENVAWFHMRVGDLLSAMGKVTEAEHAYREALDLFPDHYLTLTALTRLAAGKQDWQATIAWGRRAADIVPNPEVLALLGDAYTALCRPQEAARQYHLIEAIGALTRAQGVVYDRQRALYCADHDRNLDEALTLAGRELRARHDVYAYDTLAWVRYKHGQTAEADAAMQKALSRGTRDARLYYHAGCIALAMGDRIRAHQELSTALAINPYFQPFAPARARTLLASLK